MYRNKVSSKEQLDTAQGKVRQYHRRCKEAELMEVCKRRGERKKRERHDNTGVQELLRPAGSFALSQTGDSMQMTSLVTSHSMCTASLVSAELA